MFTLRLQLTHMRRDHADKILIFPIIFLKLKLEI